MDRKGNVTEYLKELINVYYFDLKTLGKYLGLPPRQIKMLSEGNVSFLPEDIEYRFALFNKINFLYLCAARDKDLKLSASLEVLVSSYGLSVKTIAKMAGVCEKDIERILSGGYKEVSCEIKYKIAVAVMPLPFFLKGCVAEQDRYNKTSIYTKPII